MIIVPNFQVVYVEIDIYISVSLSLSLKNWKHLASFVIGSHPTTRRLKNFSTDPTLWNAYWDSETPVHLDYTIKLLDQPEYHSSSGLYNKWEYTSPLFGPLWFHYYFVAEESFLNDKEFGTEKKWYYNQHKMEWICQNKTAVYKVKQARETLFKAFAVRDWGQNSVWTQLCWNKELESFKSWGGDIIDHLCFLICFTQRKRKKKKMDLHDRR